MICDIVAKPSTLLNTISNVILERIHQVLGNLYWNYNILKTYIYEDEPWWGILMAAEPTIRSTAKRVKCYSLCQILFGRDMIILIKHTMDWKLIQQITQIKM